MSDAYTNTCTALAVALEANVPVLLWGAPGNGKTSAIQALAAHRGAHLETVIVSLREPADMAGLPSLDTTTGGVRLAPPQWAMNLHAADGTGILFLDEISTAPPSLQASALRICAERIVGELALNPQTRVVAAANPPEIAADGFDLAAPLANRFCHLDWSIPADVVVEGLAFGWPDVPVLRPVNRDAHIAEARGLIAAFIASRPDLVSKVPSAGSDQSRGFPTPRSWEMAATLLGVCRSSAVNKAVTGLVLRGVLGDGTGTEVITFLINSDLPAAEDVIAKPNEWTVPSRGDLVYAVLAGVLAVLADSPTRDRWMAVGTVLQHTTEAGYADVAVQAGKRWLRLRPTGAKPPVEALTALARVLTQAGLSISGE